MTAPTIPEDLSEKRKQGRPAIYTPEQMAIYRRLFPEIRTERGLQECILWSRAYNLIKEVSEPWTAFYTGDDGKQVFQRAILSALGRLSHEGQILALARRVAEQKLKGPVALRFIRQMRTGIADKPRYLALFQRIATAVDEYQAAHPSTPVEWFPKALRDVADFIESDMDGAGDDEQGEPV